ncbi:hypothetical protein CCP3SC5AM1_3100002 [Gammaproteobacteria bacterium]
MTAAHLLTQRLAHQEGRMEGRTEGESKLLLRLLERRFGQLPSWVTTRFVAASETEVESW